MELLHPTYGFALLGLLIPIAIHLWNRKQGKTIRVGSIQLFSEQSSKKSSSLQLSEWVLLLLRGVILSLIVLALTGPVWNTDRNQEPMAYVVAPDLLASDARADIQAMTQQSSLYLLSTGVPQWDWESELPATKQPASLWNLIPELERIPADSIIVLTQGKQSNFKGPTPRTAKPMSWMVVESQAAETDEVIEAVKDDGKALVVHSQSDRDQQTFRYQRLSLKEVSNTDSLQVGDQWVTIQQRDSLHIELRYSDERKREAEYIAAGLRAVSKFKLIPLQIRMQQDTVKPINASTQTLIWLHDTLPIKGASKTLRWQADPLAEKLIVPTTSDDEYALTRPLTSETALNEELATSLIEFLGMDTPLQNRIRETDQRSIGFQSMQPMYQSIEKTSIKTAGVPLANWIWLVTGVLLIAERILSYIRQQ